MTNKDAAGKVSVGTAGWSYADWEGVVYPHPKPSRFDPLAYLSRYVDCIEINTTFYRPPPPSYTESWLSRVSHNPHFRFTAKLWQRFTHEREKPWDSSDVRAYKSGMEPLLSSGKLGAVLVQFPWSFPATPKNQQWLSRIASDFKEYPLVVEVRHVSWLAPESLQKLRELGVSFCNIDQPYTRSSVEPTSHATGPVGYIRFHGRNYAKWFDKKAGRDERYDYLYSEDELRSWLPRILKLAESTDETYLINNNHYRGQALVNASEIKAMLTGEKQSVPPDLLEAYPRLRIIAR